MKSTSSCADRKHGSDYALVTSQALNVFFHDHNKLSWQILWAVSVRMLWHWLAESPVHSSKQSPQCEWVSWVQIVKRSVQATKLTQSCLLTFSRPTSCWGIISHTLPKTSQRDLFHSQTHEPSIAVHVWAQVKVDAQNLQLMKDYRLWGDQNRARRTVSSYFRGLNA